MARSVLVVTVHLGEKKNARQGLFLVCWESWSVFQCKICDAQYELPAFRYPRIWPPWLSREGQKSAIAKKASVSLQPRKVVHRTSPDSANVRVFQRLNGKDSDTVNKVYEIPFYFVLQGLPFTMFVHQINLEKLHGVYYIGTYENEAACKNFIDISDYLFNVCLKKKWNRWTLFQSYTTVLKTKVSLNKK